MILGFDLPFHTTQWQFLAPILCYSVTDNNHGNTPLHWALLGKNSYAVQLLIDKPGVDFQVHSFAKLLSITFQGEDLKKSQFAFWDCSSNRSKITIFQLQATNQNGETPLSLYESATRDNKKKDDCGGCDDSSCGRYNHYRPFLKPKKTSYDRTCSLWQQRWQDQPLQEARPVHRWQHIHKTVLRQQKSGGEVQTWGRSFWGGSGEPL